MGKIGRHHHEDSMMNTRQSAWPSGDYKPLAVLDFSVDEAESIFETIFDKGQDELDSYFAAFMVHDKIGPLLLMKYTHAAIGGINVYIDSAQNTQTALTLLKGSFSVPDAKFLWTRTI